MSEETGRFRKGADLQQRAFDFACRVVALHDSAVRRGDSAREMSRQLLRASMSIGANLQEADGAQSRADFISKCCISLKEAREALYWLTLMERTGKIGVDDGASELMKTCDQLVAILTTIIRKS